MKRFLSWLWKRGFISNFLTGLFAILPLMITFWIMNWVAGWLRTLVGPDSPIGSGLRNLGLHFAANQWVATAIGWLLVIVCIWFVGLMVSGTAFYRWQLWFDGTFRRIPLVKSIYGPVKQVVEMFSKRDESAVSGMRVVHCSLGDEESASFLGLLPSSDIYRFNDQDCHIVYLPSAPMPMTGFNMFIPVNRTTIVDMDVEELMQVYFSLGVMTSSVVPEGVKQSKVTPPASGAG